MVNSAPTLADLQRWFQTVIAHPGGVELGLAAAAAQLGISLERADEPVLPSPRQSSVERLAVYARAYWARLLECLREDYPLVRRAVGDEAFDALAAAYLVDHPSTGYTLAALGAKFPTYLADTAPPGDDRPRAVAELAVLERAVTEVFDLDGGETLGFLTPDDLQRAALEPWAEFRPTLLPTVRLLEFRFDVDRWFTSLRAGEVAPPGESCPCYVALSRREFIVRRHRLSRGQFVLLRSLAAGGSLGEALAALAADEAAAELDVPDVLRTWFAAWSRAGLFRTTSTAVPRRS